MNIYHNNRVYINYPLDLKNLIVQHDVSFLIWVLRFCKSYPVKGVHCWKEFQEVKQGLDYKLRSYWCGSDIIAPNDVLCYVAPILIPDTIRPACDKETMDKFKSDFKSYFDTYLKPSFLLYSVYPYLSIMGLNKPLAHYYDTDIDLRGKRLRYEDIEAGVKSIIDYYGTPKMKLCHDSSRLIGKVETLGNDVYMIRQAPELAKCQLTHVRPGDKLQVIVSGQTYDITAAASFGATEIEIHRCKKEEGIIVIANTGYCAIHHPKYEPSVNIDDTVDAMRYAFHSAMLAGDVRAKRQDVFINGRSIRRVNLVNIGGSCCSKFMLDIIRMIKANDGIYQQRNPFPHGKVINDCQASDQDKNTEIQKQAQTNLSDTYSWLNIKSITPEDMETSTEFYMKWFKEMLCHMYKISPDDLQREFINVDTLKNSELFPTANTSRILQP